MYFFGFSRYSNCGEMLAKSKQFNEWAAYESVVVPLNALCLVGIGVWVSLNWTSVSSEESVKCWTNLVSLTLTESVALGTSSLEEVGTLLWVSYKHKESANAENSCNARPKKSWQAEAQAGHQAQIGLINSGKALYGHIDVLCVPTAYRDDCSTKVVLWLAIDVVWFRRPPSPYNIRPWPRNHQIVPDKLAKFADNVPHTVALPQQHLLYLCCSMVAQCQFQFSWRDACQTGSRARKLRTVLERHFVWLRYIEKRY